MLQVEQISLTQFKNYDFSSFKFNEKVIGICGLNGKGKTNLIDAIYYSCFTKSYFAKNDLLITQFEKDGFRIETIFRKNEELQKLVCVCKVTEKKAISLNGVEYTKFSEHIGQFPAVMIAPDDIHLITEGSDGRRKFIDTLISQINKPYLHQLIQYHKILLQRNSALKKFAEQGKTDWTLLETLDEQLVPPTNYIYTARKEFAEQFIPILHQFYEQICDGGETIAVSYNSQLHDNDFYSLLNQFRQKDFATERTNAGIHKDDIIIEKNGQLFKNIASQGQRKSVLLAFKLAEFEMLKQNKGFAPILLLDDIFEKLDEKRMSNLLHWVSKKNDGQIFITDTHKDRLIQSFEQLGVNCQIIEL